MSSSRKKHYEQAAAAVRRHREEGQPEVVAEAVVKMMGAIFSEDNPRFDMARFEKACKVNHTAKVQPSVASIVARREGGPYDSMGG